VLVVSEGGASPGFVGWAGGLCLVPPMPERHWWEIAWGWIPSREVDGVWR